MNKEYLYSYRIARAATIHRIRAPESMEQTAVQRALETKHGKPIDLLMLEKTAGALDVHFDTLSEGQAGSNDADPYGWARAYELAASHKPSIGAASWATVFKQAQAGN